MRLAQVVTMLSLLSWTAAALPGALRPMKHGRSLLQQLAPVTLNYSMVAVDSSNKLYYRASLTAPWTTRDEYVPFTPTSVLPLRDGTVLATNPGTRTIWRQSPTNPWTEIAGTCCAARVAITSDGRLVVAQADGHDLYEKVTTDVTSGWNGPIYNPATVSTLSFLADGSPLCRGWGNDTLYVHFNGGWSALSDPISLRDVVAYGNLILGLNPDGRGLQLRFPSSSGDITNYSPWHSVASSPIGAELTKIGAVPAESVVTIRPELYTSDILWVKMFH